MIFDLKVNGQTRPENIDPAVLLFSWECEDETQFTVQMSPDRDFLEAAMYLDTRNHYCTYDGFPLKKGKTYYWRVRCGVKEWAKSWFSTADTP